MVRSSKPLPPKLLRNYLIRILYTRLITPGMIALTINGNARTFEVSDFTIAELVKKMGLEGKRIAIERNGEIVPRGAFTDTVLASGDKLEIVGAVGGG